MINKKNSAHSSFTVCLARRFKNLLEYHERLLGYKIHELTCAMCCVETLPLNRCIRVEHNIKFISGRHDDRRKLSAAIATKRLCVVVTAVEYFNVVVGTLLVGLELEVLEGDFDALSVHRREVPHTIFATGVEIGPVGTTYFSSRIRDFMLTTT